MTDGGGGYERNLLEPGVIWRAIDYMHHNPIRRGLVDAPLDYPWSSVRWHAGGTDMPIECGDLPWQGNSTGLGVPRPVAPGGWS